MGVLAKRHWYYVLRGDAGSYVLDVVIDHRHGGSKPLFLSKRQVERFLAEPRRLELLVALLCHFESTGRYPWFFNIERFINKVAFGWRWRVAALANRYDDFGAISGYLANMHRMKMGPDFVTPGWFDEWSDGAEENEIC